jgi:hypothetical protein
MTNDSRRRVAMAATSFAVLVIVTACGDATSEDDDLGFLYQGFDPASDGIDYNKLPWRLGLLSPR